MVQKSKKPPPSINAPAVKRRGRPRAYLRQFGLARIAFRDMALAGFIPGVRKASW